MKSEPKKKAVIIGLGWLGMPLAETLIRRSFFVAGSVSSTEKLEYLKNIQASSADNSLKSLRFTCFNLYEQNNVALKQEEPLSEILGDSLKDASVIVNIPPGRRNFNRSLYVDKMIHLFEDLFTGGALQLIFISTTSVFNGHNTIINNQSPLAPTTESGYAHQTLEQFLFTHYPDLSCVIRPSGLVGPNHPISTKKTDSHYRHPIFSMSKKTDISRGLDPINLIHRDDLNECIHACIDQNKTNAAYNLAAALHPTRYEYYTWCAKQLGLSMPQFRQEDLNETFITEHGVNKIIDASDTCSELGLELKYPSPFDMLPNESN